jgi:type I restriction enzyme, S subunit
VKNWKTARISDFCTTGSGGTPPRSNMSRYYEGGTIPWVKSGELRETVIYDTEEHVTKAALEETNVKLIPSGTILLAMYGATVGRLGILGVPATTNQAVCHIIPEPQSANTRYLFHALCSQVSNLVARGVGGAQPNISQSIVKDLALPLPPLEEQVRIASILDQVDVLKVKHRNVLLKLETITESLRYRALRGEL